MIFKLTSSTLIAFAAVMLLFGIVGSLTSGSTDARCTIYKNVIRHVPLPGWSDRSLPPECTFDPIQERAKLEELNNLLLLKYIDRCWDKAENGMYGKNLECFELYAKTVPETIDETTLTNTMISHGICDEIPNDTLEDGAGTSTACGTGNHLFWKIDEIGAGTTIIVKYDTLAQRIEII